MKLWKSSILFVSVAVMLLSSMTVSADKTESDPTGDVAHWEYATGQWGWNYNIGNKPNIDITEMSYFVSGDQLTLTLKVDGTIQSSELNWYWGYLNTSDATYWMSWMEGEGGGMAMNIEEGSMQWDLEPEIAVSGNTLSCTFDVVGSDYSNSELWGYATEYVEAGDMTSEWWGDWAPETYSPFWGEGGDEEHIITVTSPYSGDTWYQGGTNTIGWSSENAGSYVDIDLYQDGYFHSYIASFEYNDGSYFWAVPSGLSTSSYYEIRITDSYDSSVYGYSDSFYIDELLESYITVSSPYSGDTWYQGDTSTISWSAYNAGNYVDIDLYQDGYYHSIIALSTYNDGSYSWTVPSGLNTDSYYEILITDSFDSSVYGYSGYLSIQKSLGLNFQEWIIIIAVFMVISLIIIIVVIVVIKGNPKGLPKEYRNRDTEEKLKLNKMKEKVKRWKKEGYNVDEIEQMIKSDKER